MYSCNTCRHQITTNFNVPVFQKFPQTSVKTIPHIFNEYGTCLPLRL